MITWRFLLDVKTPDSLELKTRLALSILMHSQPQQLFFALLRMQQLGSGT
jgi:hypothetical protein